jgi:hypothetical protein
MFLVLSRIRHWFILIFTVSYLVLFWCFLPSFGSFGQAVSEEKIFLNRPIRNKNCLWWPCLLLDRDKTINLYRGPSIYTSSFWFLLCLIWSYFFITGLHSGGGLSTHVTDVTPSHFMCLPKSGECWPVILPIWFSSFSFIYCIC